MNLCVRIEKWCLGEEDSAIGGGQTADVFSASWLLRLRLALDGPKDHVIWTFCGRVDGGDWFGRRAEVGCKSLEHSLRVRNL